MPEIDHVIVLMLENRSFDHLLGFLPHPSPDFGQLTGDGTYSNPAWPSGPRVAATPTAKIATPIGPDHTHDGVMEQLAIDAAGTPTNEGFVASLERRGRGIRRPTHAGYVGWLVNLWARLFGPKVAPIEGLGALAMACQPMTNVPVLGKLALEFAVCTRWFSAVPGETWPNRNFLHAATSDGETNIDTRFYTNRTIFESLDENKKTWHIYYDNTPQVWAFPRLWDNPARHANWYPFEGFREHVAANRLPTYSFIEPNHHPPLQFVDDAAGDDARGRSSSQHPENNLISGAKYDAFTESGSTDFRRAETLIADVYEALRSNQELFERSLLLITYDEHGGFYDHVPPTAVAPNPGTRQHWLVRLLHRFWRPNAARFGFTRLGVRVPTLVISPYVRRGDVDETVYDHSSVPATLRALFIPNVPPLTQRDAHANTFHHLLSLPTPRRGDLPDLSEYDRTRSVAATSIAASASVEQRSGVVPLARGSTPASYDPYIAQAKQVFRKLSRLREEEATTRLSARTPRDRATEIADRFGAAAQRHRANIRSTQPRSD